MTNDELTEALMHLFEIGAVSVSYDEDLEPRFSITEEGAKMMEGWNNK